MTPKEQNTANLSHKEVQDCDILSKWNTCWKKTSLVAFYISVEKESFFYFYVFTDKHTEYWTGEMHKCAQSGKKRPGAGKTGEEGGGRPQMRIKLPCWGILFVPFTWLETELLDSGFSSSDGCPSIFKVSLSDTGFALAARWSVRTQMSLRGRFGTSWAAVGLLNGGHLHIWQELQGGRGGKYQEYSMLFFSHLRATEWLCRQYNFSYSFIPQLKTTGGLFSSSYFVVLRIRSSPTL